MTYSGFTDALCSFWRCNSSEIFIIISSTIRYFLIWVVKPLKVIINCSCIMRSEYIFVTLSQASSNITAPAEWDNGPPQHQRKQTCTYPTWKCRHRPTTVWLARAFSLHVAQTHAECKLMSCDFILYFHGCNLYNYNTSLAVQNMQRKNFELKNV